MTAPTVEAVIHELMDLAWNVVYSLLDERGLLSEGLEVQEYSGIRSWVDDLTCYTVVHSRTVAVLFVDTRPVDAIVFQHDLLGEPRLQKAGARRNLLMEAGPTCKFAALR